jgi:hypothetical protein
MVSLVLAMAGGKVPGRHPDKMSRQRAPVSVYPCSISPARGQLLSHTGPTVGQTGAWTGIPERGHGRRLVVPTPIPASVSIRGSWIPAGAVGAVIREFPPLR